MREIIHKDLSYRITGLCFNVHKKLGRFCREKQYADELEKTFKENNLDNEREFALVDMNPEGPDGNRVDFYINKLILLDVKAKNYITKEDYFQMQRYLSASKLELGLIVNFRDSHLKPKRILNSAFHSGHSDNH